MQITGPHPRVSDSIGLGRPENAALTLPAEGHTWRSLGRAFQPVPGLPGPGATSTKQRQCNLHHRWRDTQESNL